MRQTTRRSGVGEGIRLGMLYAVLGLVVVALRFSMNDRALVREEAIVLAAIAVGLGLLGGAAFGALQPLRSRFWGRLLTAFVILFLLHGVGVFFVENVPLMVMLGINFALSAFLAPVYVGIVVLVDKFTKM